MVREREFNLLILVGMLVVPVLEHGSFADRNSPSDMSSLLTSL